jgi:hypothetical protein
MVVGHSLKDVVDIETNHHEGHLSLNLKFLVYRLYIDDILKLKELIKKLATFLDQEQLAQIIQQLDELSKKPPEDRSVDMPTFYKQPRP